MNNAEEMNIMAVMSKPVKSALIVDEAKSKQFIEQKADPAVKARILQNSERVKRHATFSCKKQG